MTLLRPGTRALTHCNTGALATGGYGTALGAIRLGWERGLVEHVWVTETRPLNQGSRLTAWELDRLGIPFSLIADSAAGSLMEAGRVDIVFTGADRIAANGDTANKIGTSGLAVLARHHNVPFVVVAPTSTLDAEAPSGDAIPIEERSAAEMHRPVSGVQPGVRHHAGGADPRGRDRGGRQAGSARRMKLLVLAAGYATRLYPLTRDRPKALLPVGARPMADWLLERVEPIGFDAKYLVTNASLRRSVPRVGTKGRT